MINLITDAFCKLQILFPWTFWPKVVKIFLQNTNSELRLISDKVQWNQIERKKMGYLEPNFEVESSAVVPSSMQKPKGNATVNAAAEEDGNSQRLIFVSHTAG